jgi:hypothetical protein
MTNKRLYLVSWSTAIRTSRRRGWCSYIELLSTCHFGLPVPVSSLGPSSITRISCQAWLSGSFFSFWLTDTECGASRGYAGGGGPGMTGGCDMRGACS